MSVAIGNDELGEFVSLLRDWRLALGAQNASVLSGETGQAQAQVIEARRRKALLDFLDLPGIDVAFEGIIAERKRSPEAERD